MPNITELSRDAARSMSPKEREGWNTEPKRRKRKEKAAPASKNDGIDNKLAFLKEQPQITTIDLRKNLGEVIGEAHFNGKARVITQHGKPMAAIVSTEDYLRLLKLKEADSGKADTLDGPDVGHHFGRMFLDGSLIETDPEKFAETFNQLMDDVFEPRAATQKKLKLTMVVDNS